MWPYRSKSTRNDNHKNGPKIRKVPSNPDFHHHSFKDFEILFPHGDNKVSDLNILHEQPSSSSHSQACSTDVRRPSVFHRVYLANRFTRAFSSRPKPDPEEILTESNKVAAPEKLEKLETSVKPENSVKSEKPEPKITIPVPGADKRVVVYMTSLRVVRPTFEACRTVRSILQGFRVPIDERDLSMDSSFSDEIRKIMAQIGEGRGEELENSRVTLPRVFIGGRYIGGAEEVVELHEIGELKKFVEGLPAATTVVCEICGGFRFILCYECNGSNKLHMEEGGFRTCTVCNEIGLIRCPSCLSS